MVDIFLDQAWKRSVYLGLGLAVARALRAAWRQNSRIFMGICLGISSILKGFKRGLMGFTGIRLGFYDDCAGMLFGCFSDFKWIKFILNGLLLGFHGFDTKIGEFQTCEHMS